MAHTLRRFTTLSLGTIIAALVIFCLFIGFIPLSSTKRATWEEIGHTRVLRAPTGEFWICVSVNTVVWAPRGRSRSMPPTVVPTRYVLAICDRNGVTAVHGGTTPAPDVFSPGNVFVVVDDTLYNCHPIGSWDDWKIWHCSRDGIRVASEEEHEAVVRLLIESASTVRNCQKASEAILASEEWEIAVDDSRPTLLDFAFDEVGCRLAFGQRRNQDESLVWYSGTGAAKTRTVVVEANRNVRWVKAVEDAIAPPMMDFRGVKPEPHDGEKSRQVEP